MGNESASRNSAGPVKDAAALLRKYAAEIRSSETDLSGQFKGQITDVEAKNLVARIERVAMELENLAGAVSEQPLRTAYAARMLDDIEIQNIAIAYFDQMAAAAVCGDAIRHSLKVARGIE